MQPLLPLNPEYLRAYIKQTAPEHELLQISNDQQLINDFLNLASDKLGLSFDDINHHNIDKIEYAKHIVMLTKQAIKNIKDPFVVIEDGVTFNDVLALQLKKLEIKFQVLAIHQLLQYRANVAIIGSPSCYSLETAGKNKSTYIIEAMSSCIHPAMDKLLSDLGYVILPDIYCFFGYFAQKRKSNKTVKELFQNFRKNSKQKQPNIRADIFKYILIST